MSLSRRLANLGKAIDSATTGHFLSKGDSDGLFETIQYTDLTGRPTVLDSANITAIVDSAYVQLRQTVAGSGGLDSAAVTTLVDSAYVSARSPAAASGFAAYEYNTSAAQTTFQDSDVNGNVLSYSANGIIVYYNGVLMPTSDYTATDGSSVVFTTAVDSGGTVTIAKWALASSGGSGGGAVWYGDRGVFGGGNGTLGATGLGIDYIDITTPGNATDFGDLLSARYGMSAASNSTRGVFFGGSYENVIQYITVASTSNSTDFGDLTQARAFQGSVSDATYGVTGGGAYSVSRNEIDYVTMDTTGNATDFGDLTVARAYVGAGNDTTYGIFGSGSTSSGKSNVIDYITIASPGNATDFGDMVTARNQHTATSDATYSVFAGGYDGSDILLTSIEYITTATAGNASSFGNLSVAVYQPSACSNGTYAVIGGGLNSSPAYISDMQYFTISTPGNASDFGDLTEVKGAMAGLSGSPS